MNNIISYLSPINIIFFILLLAYIFDFKNDKVEKYNHTTYDIINIYLFIFLVLISLITIESIFLKKLNK
jgi:ACR3 family arsenite efflux pump ArsB